MGLGDDRASKVKKIGELLVAAGVLKLDQLGPALQVSKKTGLPLGRVLIMNHQLNERDLASAVQAQTMIRDGILVYEFAVKALNRAFARMAPLDAALQEMGWTPKADMSENEMAHLLLGSQLITEKQLEEAHQKAVETRLPLGRILVLCGALTPSLLAAVLSLLVLMRDLKVTPEQAQDCLRAIKNQRVSLDDALAEQGFRSKSAKSTVRLGELFALAGLLAESDIMVAVELGLAQEVHLGQVLVDQQLVPPHALEAGLELQKLVANGSLEVSKAAEILRSVNARAIPWEQAAMELGHTVRDTREETGKAVEFLKLAGLITESVISKAEQGLGNYDNDMRRALMAEGSVDQQIFEAALKCQKMIQEGLIRTPEAIIAIHYCERTRVGLEDALEELAWDVPNSG
jgi:hypothetical protein